MCGTGILAIVDPDFDCVKLRSHLDLATAIFSGCSNGSTLYSSRDAYGCLRIGDWR
jgi:hypothetical protein